MHHNGRQNLLSKPVAPICEQSNYTGRRREREKRSTGSEFSGHLP